MLFNATAEQVAQMVANAVNAAKPMGMGLLRHNPDSQFTAADFLEEAKSGRISIDYLQGRMIKLHIFRKKSGPWFINDKFRSDYQSWCVKFPTPEALINSAVTPRSGIEFQEEDPAIAYAETAQELIRKVQECEAKG
jgi:hypothetical protein